MKIFFQTIGLVAFLLGPLNTAHAFVLRDSTTLSRWNDSDLNTSRDYIQVSSGYYGTTESWFSVQWEKGSANLLQALGIDKVFYNSAVDPANSIDAIWVGGIGTGKNVTSDWKTNYATSTGGGGFGSFNSYMSLGSSSDDGISDAIFFVLKGTSGFTANGQGAMFDVHVRYGNECSGWASDGTSTSINTGTSCGGASVPEPGSLLLLGIGLLSVGLLRWRKS